jgi:hypothetical protein
MGENSKSTHYGTFRFVLKLRHLVLLALSDLDLDGDVVPRSGDVARLVVHLKRHHLGVNSVIRGTILKKNITNQ